MKRPALKTVLYLAAIASAAAASPGFNTHALAQDAKAKKSEPGGFAEPRKGDVPVGARELMTPETDQAIEQGLAWLAKQQNTDGSYGNGAYRGNIAIRN